MRILHAINHLYHSAGTTVFVLDLSRNLMKAGNEVGVLVHHHAQEDTPVSDMPVLVSPNLKDVPVHWDVVHIHSLWSPWLSKVEYWAHANNIKVVWSPHGTLTLWALRYKCLKKILGMVFYQYWSLRKADMLHVTVTSELADVRRLGLCNPVCIAPLGVDLPNVRAVHNKNDGTKRTILFLSRINPKKGLINLISAWSQVKRSGWQIIIAGPDENHIKDVISYAEKLDVKDSVEYVGAVYDKDKEDLMVNADLFVLPTFSENFGSVVIEALSYGVPVLTTQGAPWQELVAWKCGWWIDLSVEHLATTLTQAMVLSDDERMAMGERGRQLVAEKYTWPAIGKQMKIAYEGVLKGELK